jgi:hypothetical protein
MSNGNELGAYGDQLVIENYAPNPGTIYDPRATGPGTSTSIAQGGSYADMAKRMPGLADIAFQLRGRGGPNPLGGLSGPKESWPGGQPPNQPLEWTPRGGGPQKNRRSRFGETALAQQPPPGQMDQNAKFKFLVSTGMSPHQAIMLLATGRTDPGGAGAGGASELQGGQRYGHAVAGSGTR